jgi:uncharacterized CHY-type Zn-finger protein
VAKEKPESESSTSTTDDDAILCVACEHRITSREHRIEMMGAHEHTFVNPGGIVHRIGCYAVAPGVSEIGEPQGAFSWFPGWSWQIVLCGRCRSHVGWSYRCGGETFCGLITAALR